jgi:virginiamycin B lyase
MTQPVNIQRLLVAAVALLASCASPDAPGVSFGSLPADWSGTFNDTQLVHPDVVQNGQNQLHWRSFATGMPSDSTLRGIVAGPDGKYIWYTNATYWTIGRMGMDGSTAVYQLRTRAGQFAPGNVTVGADRKLYLGGCIMSGCNVIGVLTGRGRFAVYQTPSGDGPGQSGGLAKGPDGNVWFTERSHIGKITPSGQVTEYVLPSGYSVGGHITAGGDGQVWFDEAISGPSYGATLARIDPVTGKITQLQARCPYGCTFGPLGIAGAGNGDVYLLAAYGGYSANYDYLGRFSHRGLREWIDVSATNGWGPLVEGPDGALWWGARCDLSYSPPNPCSVARFDPAMHRLSVAFDRSDSVVVAPASGPDGNIWGIGAPFHGSPPNFIVVFVRNVLDVHPAYLGFAKSGTTATLTATYTGTSPLSAYSSDPSVASVAPTSPPGTFIVTAIAVGLATITVRDTMRNSFNVSVTVN